MLNKKIKNKIYLFLNFFLLLIILHIFSENFINSIYILYC